MVRGAREFGVPKTSLGARLKEAGESPDESGLYGTAQLTRVLYGSIFAERARLVREAADKISLANQVARGELLLRSDLGPALAKIAEATINVIESSTLTGEEKYDLRRTLGSMRLVVSDAAKKQVKGRLNGRGVTAQPVLGGNNGATTKPKKRGRPRKAPITKPAVAPAK